MTRHPTRLPATMLLAPGETIDVEVLRPQAESLTLEIVSPQSAAVQKIVVSFLVTQ